MSTRLHTLASSLVAVSLVASVATSIDAFADRVSEPAPVATQPSPVATQPTPSPPPEDVTPVPVQHFAQPVGAGRRRAPAPATAPAPAPAMDREQLRIVLRAERAKNLAAFEAYARAGIYPSNTYDTGELNVWRDRDGHLCAAATVIAKSGATDLVARVADQNNFIKLADIQQGPLEDWILTSGFTQAELVRIQRPFVAVTKPAAPAAPALEHAPAVDPDRRVAETARLRQLYATIDAELVRDEAKSLDAAADRLLAHPTLAWRALGYAN